MRRFPFALLLTVFWIIGWSVAPTAVVADPASGTPAAGSPDREVVVAAVASESVVLATEAQELADRELSTYQLTAIAVGMRIDRAKLRASQVASVTLEADELIDLEAERGVLEGMLRSHAETGDRNVAKNRLESARLDQKLMQSRASIMLSRLAALEAEHQRLNKEYDASQEELAESVRLRAVLEKRRAILDHSEEQAPATDLRQRKKDAISELIEARKAFEGLLTVILDGIAKRRDLLEMQIQAGKSAESLYQEFNEKIATVIRKLEESIRRMNLESVAQQAKAAADAARREIETVDDKLENIDKDLVSDKTASSTSISLKAELVARRDHLLSQKDALTEQARYHELRGKSAQDIAQFEEIEAGAAAGEVASGQVLAVGMKEWIPRIEYSLIEYQNEKRLVEKRLELMTSTRLMIDRFLAEKPDSAKKEEIRYKKLQLAQIQAAVQTLGEQISLYDSLIKSAFSAKQIVQRAIESEMERNLFARLKFRPRPTIWKTVLRDLSALPAALSSKLAVLSGLLSIGLLAQILFTLIIGIGACWVLGRMRGDLPSCDERHTLLQWLKRNRHALAAVAILVALGGQIEPLIVLGIVPAVLLGAILVGRFAEQVLLRFLPEKHILRIAFSRITGILLLGIPPIALLRWFDVYPEIVFVVGLVCKIALVWPFVSVIKGANAFYGLMQYHFDLKPDSRLLRLTVLAYKFISVLNFVCLLTALYGYENLALFVFRRNLEAFGIIMLVAVGKPMAERLSVILFDPDNGAAAAYVGRERAQFLLFLGKKTIRLFVYLVAVLAAASFVGITTDSFAVRLVVNWFVGQSDWLVARIIRIIIIIAAILLVLKFVQTLGESVIEYVKNESRSSLTENERRASTLVQILNTSARVVLFCIGGIMILRELGMDITPLLTGAGIVGVAIGFGSQSLVKDFFAGFFILVENQFRVGDVIEIGGRSGVVERINLKTTVLRATDGSVFIIPNGEITSVKNMTYAWSRAVLDIGVAYETDLDKAFGILQKVGDELAADPALSADIWGRPEVLGVENLDNSAIVLRMLVKTRPLTQWQVSRIFRKKIKEAFDLAGIQIPFPQQVVTLKADPELLKYIGGREKQND
ncbi:MAG TPA: mechanosensitive ion channel [Candidatus Ozemobacteraceae bacterium]|nr:mechanosensitive ion channel [Candidatus Ozemobacteraceae bacterium]